MASTLPSPFTTDGSHLASGGSDSITRVWDVSKLNEFHEVYERLQKLLGTWDDPNQAERTITLQSLGFGVEIKKLLERASKLCSDNQKTSGGASVTPSTLAAPAPSVKKPD